MAFLQAAPLRSGGTMEWRLQARNIEETYIEKQ